MQYTSTANALLVLAIAPFLAAILSLFLLRERID
ncbi:MAG: EamA/RhaT family transporter, partial [Tabrizicola sp.]